MSSTKRTPTRRDFLRTAAAGAAGLALARGATAGLRPPLAKSCIFINLVGGPSHLDTFDPKPSASAEYRGPFRAIQTTVPGLHLSELFPKMAAMADKFSLIRSMHHDAPPIHECGFQLLNTGHLFRDGPEWPNNGIVLSQVRHPLSHDSTRVVVTPETQINTGVNIGHGFSGGWLGRHPEVWGYSPRSNFDFTHSGAVALIESFGASYVTVNMYDTVFDSPSWDCHADRGSLRTDLNDYRDTVAPTFDTAFTTLLTDLEERGMLDSTLVVATGEFGRTPLLNSNGGRDHWPGCWTAIVAGGGVKGGRIIGASDKHGTAPKDRPVAPQELVATIFHALGVSPTAAIPGPDGSPVAVYPAQRVTELF